METAGRAQRESIDRSSQLLRVLAGWESTNLHLH
jgi:hypothetical protein